MQWITKNCSPDLNFSPKNEQRKIKAALKRSSDFFSRASSRIRPEAWELGEFSFHWKVKTSTVSQWKKCLRVFFLLAEWEIYVVESIPDQTSLRELRKSGECLGSVSNIIDTVLTTDTHRLIIWSCSHLFDNSEHVRPIDITAHRPPYTQLIIKTPKQPFSINYSHSALWANKRNDLRRLISVLA